jgi:(E)-4-hydroxy-3-methylbut-2-enyl-diphosphate synthase
MHLPDHITTYFEWVTREVMVGSLAVGGNNPVRIQSMTNTNTSDTRATVRQVAELFKAGCELIRIAAPGIREAENLNNIKNELQKKDIDVPLIADIHFNPKAAEIAAQFVEKVRINPGNYVDRIRSKVNWTANEIAQSLTRISERLEPLLKICKKNGTAIRVGINHGSLSERILTQYGNTPLGMVESAMEFIRICHDFGFHNLVLSMKASDVMIMIEANELLVNRMLEKGFNYPLHLGVTEAGAGDEGRIKSAAGIGNLLARGIGDTIRVSLTEDPVNEIPFAKRLVSFVGRKNRPTRDLFNETSTIILRTKKSLKEITGQKHPVITTGYSGMADLFQEKNSLVLSSDKSNEAFEYKQGFDQSEIDQPVIFKLSMKDLIYDDLLIRTSIICALLSFDNMGSGLWIESDIDSDRNAELILKILQALGLRFSKAEFIACPSCGRTQFDIMNSFTKVKKETAHLKGLKIAVMGCIVNGPGEMAGADYGYVGSGPGKVTLYKHGEPVIKNVHDKNAIDLLLNLIKESGDWSPSK